MVQWLERMGRNWWGERSPNSVRYEVSGLGHLHVLAVSC